MCCCWTGSGGACRSGPAAAERDETAVAVWREETWPVESVWSHLKRSLANLVKRDLAQLTALAKSRLRRMQYRPGLIDGFLAGTRLDLSPLRDLRN
jgi:hypothetical protein